MLTKETIKFLLFILLLSNIVYSQSYPKDFTFPLQIPISLAANYAELRPNHFHAGLDIKTQQRTGLKVFAPQEGYVSRINISPYGYGKAIYIAHPNGYTTVYGHLSALVGLIEEKARKEQYHKKSYSVDFHLKPNEIPVKQGELIALSGNTGGSGGPHLHFEIRNTKTEEVLNPFLFGLDVPDHIKPQVNGVWIYPLSGKINGNKNKTMVALDGRYNVSGSIGFGVKAYDRQDSSSNLNGVYSIKTYVNSQLISTFQADKHSFDQARAINESIDYPEYLSKNSWIYLTYLLPGNTLQMYTQYKNRGIVEVQKDSVYQVKIEVGDFAGNRTIRTFTMKGVENISSPLNHNETVKHNKPFSFSQDGISVKFDKGSFDENYNFIYNKQEANRYQIHNSSVPVMKKYDLTIKPDWSQLDPSKAEKYIIAWESNFGKYHKEYLDTEYKNGVYSAKPRDLGIFSLWLDESDPTISCPMLVKSSKTQNKLSFIIKDTGSGIKTYNIFIDGKWVLAEYEYKNNTLFISDLGKEGINSGLHQVEVVVTDKVNNKQTYTNNFEKL